MAGVRARQVDDLSIPRARFNQGGAEGLTAKQHATVPIMPWEERAGFVGGLKSHAPQTEATHYKLWRPGRSLPPRRRKCCERKTNKESFAAHKLGAMHTTASG